MKKLDMTKKIKLTILFCGILILFLGFISGFYVHKYQPLFYTKIKNELIIGKIIINLAMKNHLKIYILVFEKQKNMKCMILIHINPIALMMRKT